MNKYRCENNEKINGSGAYMGKSIEIIRHNLKYIIFAGVLLFVGAVIGGILGDQLYGFIEEQLSKIQELGEKISANGNPLYASWVIFWNNLQAALVFIILGSVFGIMPFLGLLLNGMLIGVVLSLVGDTAISSLMVFAVGVLPHGIFEIPAILIAGGFGLKLGTVWLKPIAGMKRWESFKYTWAEILDIIVFVVMLLVVAALIEGLITPLLMNIFIGQLSV
jgi:stage II sporulation protein M